MAQNARIVVSLGMTNKCLTEVSIDSELKLALELGRLLVEDVEEYVPYANGEAVNHGEYLKYNSPLDYLIQTSK